MSDTSVSVIVPVYNGQSTLPMCLESILSQTFDDFELLVVNDGSSDESAEIASRYAAKDTRIRVIEQANLGPGAARNTGICNSKGRYLAFIDNDDFIDESMLEKLHSSIEEAGAQIAVCQSSIDFAAADGGFEQRGELTIPGNSGCISGFAAFSLLANQIAPAMNSACLKLFDRLLLVNNGLRFPENHSFVEDMHLCSAAFLMADRVSIVRENLYHYVKSNSSRSTSYSVKKAADIVEDMNEIVRYANEASYTGTLDNFQLSMLFSAIKHIVWSEEGGSSLNADTDDLLSWIETKRKSLSPNFEGLDIPLIQRAKIKLTHKGMASLLCKIAKPFLNTPLLKYSL